MEENEQHGRPVMEKSIFWIYDVALKQGILVLAENHVRKVLFSIKNGASEDNNMDLYKSGESIG